MFGKGFVALVAAPHDRRTMPRLHIPQRARRSPRRSEARLKLPSGAWTFLLALACPQPPYRRTDELRAPPAPSSCPRLQISTSFSCHHPRSLLECCGDAHQDGRQKLAARCVHSCLPSTFTPATTGASVSARATAGGSRNFPYAARYAPVWMKKFDLTTWQRTTCMTNSSNQK